MNRIHYRTYGVTGLRHVNAFKVANGNSCFFRVSGVFFLLFSPRQPTVCTHETRATHDLRNNDWPSQNTRTTNRTARFSNFTVKQQITFCPTIRNNM